MPTTMATTPPATKPSTKTTPMATTPPATKPSITTTMTAHPAGAGGGFCSPPLPGSLSPAPTPTHRWPGSIMIGRKPLPLLLPIHDIRCLGSQPLLCLKGHPDGLQGLLCRRPIGRFPDTGTTGGPGKGNVCEVVSLRRHCPDQVPGGRRPASELSPASQPFRCAPPAITHDRPM